MEQYISKSAVVAEIRKRLLPVIRDKHYDEWEEGQNCERIAILDMIDTLEVKEVDLDSERRKYLTEHFNVYEDGILQSKRSNLPLDTYDVIKLAKHFFELGLNASNPLTWEDIKLIWNITDEMDNMPEEGFYKEVLKRFKAQKGE